MSVSPPTEKAIKEQRDRFVAFAFACADMFIEISEDGKILSATGASKGLTGIDEKALIKQNWLSLFSTYEQARMEKMREMARPGARCGPALIALNEQIGQKLAVLNAIKLPNSDRFYLSLGVSNEFIAKIAPLVSLPGSTGFLSAENYADAAVDAFFDAKLWGQDVAMTFFDFSSANMEQLLGKDTWPQVEKLIGETMAQYSFGGHSAGEVSEARYSFVHDRNLDIEEVKQQIYDLARHAKADAKPFDIEATSITAELDNISRKDIARAVDYSVEHFAENGTKKTPKTLLDGYTEYLDANALKLKEFKSIIERVSFGQLFQPIINLKTREATHYEILSKFESGDTQEWVRFGEDAGLATDYDLAVAERAFNHIKFKGGNTRTKFSINICGQTIRDEDCYERFKEELVKHKNIADRLMLEITESNNLEDLARINIRIKELKKEGFKIALDDFKPCSSALQYLQELNVDAVKIDGKFIRKFAATTRDTALLKNLAETCHAMGVQIIAESIEEKAQADMLLDMGIDFGQGNYYHAPASKPDYVVSKG